MSAIRHRICLHLQTFPNYDQEEAEINAAVEIDNTPVGMQRGTNNRKIRFAAASRFVHAHVP